MTKKKNVVKRLVKKTGVFVVTGITLFVMSGFGNIVPANTARAEVSRDDMKKLFKPIEKNAKKTNYHLPKSSAVKVDKTKENFVADEVLVKFKEDKINIKKYLSQKNGAANLEKSIQGKAVQAFASKFNLEKKENILSGNMSVLKIKDGQNVADKLKSIQQDPNVEHAQPNFKYSPTSINPSNDPLYSSQWALNNTGQTFEDMYGNEYTGKAGADINAPEAWAVSEGNSSVIAAVIDTGVAYDHEDLAANMWDGSSCKDENNQSIVGGCPNHGWDYDNNDDNPAPDTASYYMSHGTHVSGIIAAADNTKGIVGVAPHTRIMALKTEGLTTDIIVKAIAFAQNNGARVINASWGGYEDDDVLKAAIQNFDGLFMAAAGNEENDNDGSDSLYPCSDNLDNIICVAATNMQDKLKVAEGIFDWGSNYGATSVDVGAPGTTIASSLAEKEIINEKFTDATLGEIPSGFAQTGGTGHKWQVGNAPDEVDNGFGKVLFADSSYPYGDTANTTFGNATVYDLSNSAETDISFDTACDTEYDVKNQSWKDYMALEFSANGTDFSEVARWDKETLASPYTPSLGFQSGYYFDAIPSHYLTSNFKFRFRWVTNGSNNNYGGCFIDNLNIHKYTNDGSGTYYDYWDGTSMATPHVTGLASLLWETSGSLSKAAVKNAILTTGDQLSTLEGATVSGRRINAYNALTQKKINSFSLNGLDPAVAGTVNEATHSIFLRVPSGTDISSLAPTIDFSGASISPSSGAVQNFSSPVTYTVTAANGATQQYSAQIVYDPEITAFSFDSTGASGDIDSVGHTISVTVPYGTDVTNLAPTVSIIGDSVSPASGVAQDFASPVTYTARSNDGAHQDYLVTVTAQDGPFSEATVTVSGSSDDPPVVQTHRRSLPLVFSGVDNATGYKMSARASFKGAKWKKMRGSVKVKLRKISRLQTFYFKFKDANGLESDPITKTFKFLKK